MSQTLTLRYKEDEILTNAYSVSLEFEDGSFGIVDISTGTNLIFSDPPGIFHPSTGVYTYEFDPSPGQIYRVSWKIYSNQAPSEPIYMIQEVGPYYSIDTGVKSVADYKGTFVQGTIASLLLKITRFDGNPVNPDSITYEIFDINNSSVIDGTPEKVTDGYFCFEWSVDATQEPGTYSVIWNYIIDGVETKEYQEVTVSKDVTDTNLYSGMILGMRTALEFHLGYIQTLPVYFEQAKISRDNQKYEFTFPRWNQSAGIRIYRNKQIVSEGFEIDYFRGSVTFNKPLLDYDLVNADYNFRWYADEHLDRFIQNAIGVLNCYPPHSGYNVYNIETRFIPAVLYGAAVDAIRQLMMSLITQEPQVVFGGPDNAKAAFSNLETLKKNYEDLWIKILENKKFGPYPHTKSVIVPEYTLPGGRSRWFRYLFGGQAG